LLIAGQTLPLAPLVRKHEKMPKDSLSHVADWLRPANESATPPAGANSSDDPLIGLIEERDRLLEVAADVEVRAKEIEQSLPENAQRGRVKVSILGIDFELSEKNGLNEFLWSCRDLIMVRRSRMGRRQDWSAQDDAHLNSIKEKVACDFEAGLAQIEAARESSGYSALRRQRDEIDDQLAALEEKIFYTPASSFEALLLQPNELRYYARENPSRLDTIIAGVERLASHGCAPK
jgi:hypothetical protein